MGELSDQTRNTSITSESYKKYKKRLQYLTLQRRNEIAELLSTTREFGDISENFEFQEAKNEQAQLEAEILDIENIIRTAIVISEEKISADQVNIGTVVRVFNEFEGIEEEYSIAGSDESDPLNNIVSKDSPIGQALFGKKIGDVARVDAPVGQILLRILDISK